MGYEEVSEREKRVIGSSFSSHESRIEKRDYFLQSNFSHIVGIQAEAEVRWHDSSGVRVVCPRKLGMIRCD